MTLFLFLLTIDYQAIALAGQFFVVMTQSVAQARQPIADMTHLDLFNPLFLHPTSKQYNQMKFWVFIYKEPINELKVALTTSVSSIISYQQLNVPILYLRPFKIPFDAVAHKYLLSNLSKKSVLDWIDKHKEETEMWLNALN